LKIFSIADFHKEVGLNAMFENLYVRLNLSQKRDTAYVF